MYKRQLLDEASVEADQDKRAALVEQVDPVSYTHLDVYKRQFLDR